MVARLYSLVKWALWFVTKLLWLVFVFPIRFIEKIIRIIFRPSHLNMRPTNGNSLVFKPKSISESEKPPTIILDGKTGEIIEQKQLDETLVEENHCLPSEIMALASLNHAFRDGIKMIHAMNLEVDEFEEAIDALYQKYTRRLDSISN